jgi:uncharacterized protein (TIGR00255 family)
MTKSMTGFARVENESAIGRLTIELRAVNHRYLEISPHLPEELRRFEGDIRRAIQKHLARGKINCNVRFKPALSESGLVLDNDVTTTLLNTIDTIEHKMHNAARITALDFMKWPGVIKDDKADAEATGKVLIEQLQIALKQLIEMRKAEGQRLEALILKRLDQILIITQKVQTRLPEVLAAVREKLLNRLTSLEVDADSNRLEQELAIIAQKMDVAEELDRLLSHIEATRETLARGVPAGRKLDFVMQEFNREANTLSSKSSDTETTQAAVELKVLIEQMREQVQNIE